MPNIEDVTKLVSDMLDDQRSTIAALLAENDRLKAERKVDVEVLAALNWLKGYLDDESPVAKQKLAILRRRFPEVEATRGEYREIDSMEPRPGPQPGYVVMDDPHSDSKAVPRNLADALNLIGLAQQNLAEAGQFVEQEAESRSMKGTANVQLQAVPTEPQEPDAATDLVGDSPERSQERGREESHRRAETKATKAEAQVAAPRPCDVCGREGTPHGVDEVICNPCWVARQQAATQPCGDGVKWVHVGFKRYWELRKCESDRDAATQRAERAERERHFANRQSEKVIATLGRVRSQRDEAKDLLRKAWGFVATHPAGSVARTDGDEAVRRTCLNEQIECFLQAAAPETKDKDQP